MWGACDYGSNVQADTTATVYWRQSTRTQRWRHSCEHWKVFRSPMGEAFKRMLATETR